MVMTRLKVQKKRIYNEAKRTGWFETVNVFGPENITPCFRRSFHDVLKLKRGAGYWIWKFDIITKKLSEIAYNDILVYADAGCTVNSNVKKK
jgi:hypothetical protein